jgi:hypothetical protein
MDDPPNDVLTQRFHSFLPQLIPQDFVICQLPNEISCFVERVVQTLELSTTLPKTPPTTESTATGNAGNNSAPNWTSTTSSSMIYPDSSKNWSENLSSITFDIRNLPTTDEFVDHVRNQWWNRQYALPQASWLRRSNVTTGQVPFTSQTVTSLCPPSDNN